MSSRQGARQRRNVSPPTLAAAMSRPRFYPHRPSSVRFLQTHVSMVFLAGDLVYKVKKPVNFGFLDYSTLGKRALRCRREVELNSRLAPGVYLGVAPIYRQGQAWSLEPPGEVAEYAVVMKRLPEGRLLSSLMARGKATVAQARRTGRWLASFHETAPPAAARNCRLTVLRRNLEENFRQTEPYIGRTVSLSDYERVYGYNRLFLADRSALLRRRIREGRIRRCHGDLHAEHICFTGRGAGNPWGIVAFDCIEFNPRISQTDVAAEVAFLYMDLLYHRHPHLARAFAEEYIGASGDWEIRLLLPFYACYRAVVREKVESLRFSDPRVPRGPKAEARRRAAKYFHLARDLAVADGRPRLFAVGGLPGTGKSTFARLWAERAGARYFNSDALRKEMAGGAAAAAPWSEGIYTPEWTRRTYEELCRRGEESLRAGRSAVLDATFSKGWQRRLAAAAAGRGGGLLVAAQCRCAERLIGRRLRERRGRPDGGPSDADWGVYLAMKREYEKAARGTVPIDTGGPPEEGLAALAAAAYRL